MVNEYQLDKPKLINELKEIHIDLVDVYKKIFDHKYKTNESFKEFIDKEYSENGVNSKEQKAWNDNFCHRASYTLLNKMLFIRICEDKGFMLNPEDYIAGEPKDPHIGEKLSKIGLQKWAGLVTNYTLGELVEFAFLDMKKSYSNIILYKEDRYEILNPSIEELSLKYINTDNKTQDLVLQFERVLYSVIEKLDTNNFNFKNTDGNILGDVYEKFMDRETRKAIGQFYTPEFVIDIILKNTLANVDVVGNPFVSVADISCGSGHFLIMAYDILKEKFINNLDQLRDKYVNVDYIINRNGKEIKVTGQDYWKKENLHYHLLKHCIFGADIDSFAIQLTTINLLLKDLDNFTDEINVVECDSLIKWDMCYDWKYLEEQLKEEFETIEITQLNLFLKEEKIIDRRPKENYYLKYGSKSSSKNEEIIDKEKATDIINLCKFWNRTFDIVVGNPPYMGQKGNKLLFEKYKNNHYWKDYYERKQDIYYYFIIKGISMLKNGGKLGYITPPYWLTANATSKLKNFVVSNACLEKVYDFENEKIFDDAQINGNIFIFGKQSCRNTPIEIYQYDKTTQIFNKYISKVSNKDLSTGMWNIFVENEEVDVFDNIDYSLLGDIATISPGIQTGADYVSKSHIEKYHMSNINVNEGIYVISEKEKTRKFQTYDNTYIKPFYKNSDIDSYYSNLDTDKYILITNEIDNIDDYPNIKQHLFKYKKILDNRYRNFALKKADCEGKWFALYGYRPNTNFDGPKIVTPYRGKTSKFSYVDKPYYASIDVFYINLNNTKFSYLFIVGILNSILILYWLEKNCKKKGENFEFYTEPLSNIPIINVNKKYQSEISVVVNEIIDIKKEICELRDPERIIKSAKISNVLNEIIGKLIKLKKDLVCKEKELNLLVYKVYNVNKDAQAYIEDYLRSKGKIFNEFNENEVINEIINELKKQISKYIVNIINEFFINQKYYINLEQMKNILETNINNFYELIDLLKETNRKYIDVLKDILKSELYSWSMYRKEILNQNVNRVFVSYYDTNTYGLAEWSDEVHKNYFLDAIEEFTINNPNEKKANDILKLFKDLDIEDKQDYIEVIENKIKNTFS